MKRTTLPAFGLLLAFAVALFGQENPTRGEPATIEGIVSKLGTGEPLRDVHVTATGASGANKVTTNAQGRFVIADLAPGTYNLDACATLFVRARRNSLNLNVGWLLRRPLSDTLPTDSRAFSQKLHGSNKSAQGHSKSISALRKSRAFLQIRCWPTLRSARRQAWQTPQSTEISRCCEAS